LKRRELLRRIEAQGCELFRHGGRHDIYHNPATGRRAPVLRHAEIADTLARLIFRQLGLAE